MRVILDWILGPLGFIITAGLLFSERFRGNYLVVGLACALAAGSAWLTIEEFAKRSVLKHIEQSTAPPSQVPTTQSITADEVFWLSIKDSKAPGLFEEFINRFPTSKYLRDARMRLEQLKNERVVSSPPTPIEPPLERFCVTVNSKRICE